MVDNQVVTITNYATEALPITLSEYGEAGYALVSAVIAKNQYLVDVMYLFFTKEITDEDIEK